MEDPPVFLRRALGAKGHFDLSLERGEGRAQLVRRVRREAARLGEGRLQAGQHRIERVDEMIDLILGPAPGEPSTQILGGDLTRGPGHVPHGAEGAAGDHEAAHHGEGDGHRHECEKRGEVAGQRIAQASERSRDLDDLDATAVSEHGDGEEPHRSAPWILERLEGTTALRGIGAGLRGQGKGYGGRGGTEARTTLGVEELIVAIGEAGAEEVADGPLHLGVARPALVGFPDDLGDGGEGGGVRLRGTAQAGICSRCRRGLPARLGRTNGTPRRPD